MATAEDWLRLRQMMNELDDSNGWTDERLDILLVQNADPDGTLDFSSAAAAGWKEKAASLTTLVNITENGSSRSMSQEFEHALKMAAMWGNKGEDQTGESSLPRPGSGRIVRPTRG